MVVKGLPRARKVRELLADYDSVQRSAIDVPARRRGASRDRWCSSPIRDTRRRVVRSTLHPYESAVGTRGSDRP